MYLPVLKGWTTVLQVLQEEPPTPRREEEEQFAPLPALDLGSLDALQKELDAKVTASYAPVPKPYRPWEDLTPTNTGMLLTLHRSLIV